MAVQVLYFILSIFVVVTICERVPENDDVRESDLLSRHIRAAAENMDCKKKIDKSGLELINTGIKFIDPSIRTINGFRHALREVYATMQKEKSTIIKRIGDELAKGFPKAAEDLKKQTSGFQEALIYMYTTDYVYGYLNWVLRSHTDCTNLNLDNKQRSLAPYAAGLMASLLYWDELNEVSVTAYRSLNLSKNALALYTPGKIFTWPSFSSSSDSEVTFVNFPGNVHFIMNNKAAGLRPRDIKQYSAYKNEDEVLYAPGVLFQVDRLEHNDKWNATEVYLTLLAENSANRAFNCHKLIITSIVLTLLPYTAKLLNI